MVVFTVRVSGFSLYFSFIHAVANAYHSSMPDGYAPPAFSTISMIIFRRINGIDPPRSLEACFLEDPLLLFGMLLTVVRDFGVLAFGGPMGHFTASCICGPVAVGSWESGLCRLGV